MKIEPINRTKISEQVFEQMKQQMLLGEWKAGDKLPSENELANAFNVSRVTIRQALQKLMVLGLIKTKTGEGSFITEAELGSCMNTMIPMAYLRPKDTLEVLEFRQVIEIETAGLAAKKATAQDVEALQNIYDEMLALKDNMEDFAQADLEFHLKIAEITKNNLIISTHNILKDILSVTMKDIVGTLGYEIGIYYHQQLLDSIAQNDAEKTKEIMREHVVQTLNGFKENKKLK
ncbi:FadR/GntR family transcriptional regulator [Oscillospiraceae bacterium PP1C4]